MTEILFYHLDRQPIERVLPDLLERCVDRGWRTVVQVGSDERLDALDAHLWTYREEAFLPHGTSREKDAAAHPIWLTTADDNPNGATVRFLTDGVEFSGAVGYQRIVLLFDGNDAEAVDRARATWTRVKGEGHDATYWRQSEQGRWEKKG